MRMGLFSRLTHLISVPKCVCCGERLDYGELALCPKCSAVFDDIKTRNCSKCSKILSECDCSTDYLRSHYIKTMIKIFRYKNREENIAANSLIYSLKRDNRSDVLDKCAGLLHDAIANHLGDVSDFIITNVPRRRSQIIKYGIDHAELLAKQVAKLSGARYVRLLVSNVKTEQKSLLGSAREANIDFDIMSDENLKGQSVIIIDDIVTTGASMGAAAMLIRGLGAKRIVGASLAIAYKDNFSYI